MILNDAGPEVTATWLNESLLMRFLAGIANNDASIAVPIDWAEAMSAQKIPLRPSPPRTPQERDEALAQLRAQANPPTG